MGAHKEMKFRREPRKQIVAIYANAKKG